MSLLMGIAHQIAISINNAMAYRKIAESEKRFRSLSESAPDIIYTIDKQGVFTYVNPAWERILGHRVEDVLGRYFTDFLRKEDVPFYFDLFKDVPDDGMTPSGTSSGRSCTRTDRTDTFSISGAPNLDSEGNVIGVVGTFKDVTDSMLSEAKLRTDFEKLQERPGQHHPGHLQDRGIARSLHVGPSGTSRAAGHGYCRRDGTFRRPDRIDPHGRNASRCREDQCPCGDSEQAQAISARLRSV